MKSAIFALAACAALIACNDAAEEADDPLVAATAPPVGTVETLAGTYEVTMANGTVVMQTLRSDGTYNDMADGEVIETGTWRTDEKQLCFDPEGDGEEQCFAGGPAGPDGSFQTHDGDGNVLASVRRVGDENLATEPTA
ncbi:hypothetical protein [Qipengyuania sp. MTN3-11]|uniref:hypothetical protein n=1 Tax=Qipengyuania sp. MTN3-11 TaxID=3056557 RepID=UPI0036F1E335